MANRTLRWLALGALGLPALHGLLWLGAAVWLDAEVAAQEALLRRQGWSVDHGAFAHGGWPFAVRIDVPDLRLLHRASGHAWQSGRLEIAFDLRRPARLELNLHGPHLAALAGATPVAIEGPPVEVTVALAEPHPIDIAAHTLRIRPAAGVVTLDRASVHAEPAPDAVTLHAEAAGLDLGGLLPASPLGSRIDGLGIDAGLDRLGQTTPAAWRDAGGMLALHRIAVTWSRFEVELGGVITLDAALQPEGTGMIAAGGLPEAIDAMVGAGVIPAGTARTAKTLLRFVPRTADGKLTVPLALKARTLSAARLPVAVIPEIRWPDPRGP